MKMTETTKTSTDSGEQGCQFPIIDRRFSNTLLNLPESQTFKNKYSKNTKFTLSQ